MIGVQSPSKSQPTKDAEAEAPKAKNLLHRTNLQAWKRALAEGLMAGVMEVMGEEDGAEEEEAVEEEAEEPEIEVEVT